MRPRTRLVLGAVGVVLVLVTMLLRRHRRGVAVSVENEETFTLRDVTVHTSAGAYPLGDLAPVASAQTTVGARGETTVSMTWRDAAGAEQRATADVYLEGSPDGVAGYYAGTIDFEVRGGRAQVDARVGASA